MNNALLLMRAIGTGYFAPFDRGVNEVRVFMGGKIMKAWQYPSGKNMLERWPEFSDVKKIRICEN